MKRNTDDVGFGAFICIIVWCIAGPMWALQSRLLASKKFVEDQENTDIGYMVIAKDWNPLGTHDTFCMMKTSGAN